MFWAVLAARVIVGGMFFVFGVNYFLGFLTVPPPPPDSPASAYLKLLVGSHYLDVVKVLEIVGGAFVLSGRLVPLGLVLLTPVAVNVLLYEIFLLGVAGPGLGLTVLCGLLVWAYRSHFAAVFAVKPTIG